MQGMVGHVPASSSVAELTRDFDAPIVSAMAGVVHALLTEDELALFAGFGRPRHLAPGECLFRRGDCGDVMYVVLEGTVMLDFGEDLVVKRLCRGEFFGELGLLIGDHLRVADALAEDDVQLLQLDSTDFQRLVERDPSLIAYFLRRSIVRVVGNEQALIRQLRRRNHDLEAALDNLYTTTHQLNHTEELVRTDELTGLHNRRGLTVYLHACREAGRPPQALLLIDCDHFKRVNDEHGHMVGDRVLQSVGNILRSVAGEHDLACRLGGDEFCLLLRDSDEEAVQHVAEFLLSEVQGLLGRPAEAPLVCPVSIGACCIDAAGGWGDWYAYTDAALYEAKRRGGNRVHWRPLKIVTA